MQPLVAAGVDHEAVPVAAGVQGDGRGACGGCHWERSRFEGRTVQVEHAAHERGGAFATALHPRCHEAAASFTRFTNFTRFTRLFTIAGEAGRDEA